MDLDDEIRRLEAELAADDDDSESEEDEGSDEEVDASGEDVVSHKKTISLGENSVREYGPPRSLSYYPTDQNLSAASLDGR